MCDCKQPIYPFRVVNNRAERNTIPCDERTNGMIVTVVNENYIQYQLQTPKGGDICANINWKKVSFDPNDLVQYLGTFVEDELPDDNTISSLYLDTKYPNSLPGFRVMIVPLNTTFMKVQQGRWVITNDIINDETNP